MARAKGKQKSTFHDFTMLHNEFIDNTALNAHEKLVFIAIKRHLNKDTLQAFPSLATISKHARISKRAVQRAIETLTDKGIIQVEHRKDKENNGNRSNEYTLYDYKSMWTATSDKEIKSAIDIEHQAEIASGLSTEILQRELEKRNKEKGLVSDSSQTADTSTMNYNSSKENDSTKKAKSQAEQYTMADVKTLFDYSVLIADHPEHETDLQVVFDILYEVLNSSKPTIRVSGEDKPQAVIAGKLMKLTSYDIEYAIDKFHQQTGEIKNTRAYLLTILYHAREQSYLDLMNLGHRNGDF